MRIVVRLGLLFLPGIYLVQPYQEESWSGLRVSASFQAVQCGSCLGGLESPEVATLRPKAEL